MNEMYSIAGKVAVISGAGGVLGGSVATSFVKEGCNVVALDIRQEQLDRRVEELRKVAAKGVEVVGLICNVLDMDSLRKMRDDAVAKFGKIDILINIAGGNMPGATLRPDQTIWEMDIECWQKVTNLNMNGTVYPSIVVGEQMAKQGFGCMVNISSMAALQSMTNVPGYSAAKSAVTNFTQWMAMEMALKFGDKIRVNSVAPGFFIGDQNRAVLLNPDGSLTERSHKVLANTPMKRFGDITELNGCIQFLCSDAASFITGANIPIDGGFSTFSGV